MAPASPTAQRGIPAPLVLAGAFTAGSIPFANLAARLTRGVDLRHVGHGTVSGTALYEVAGFAPLAVAGVAEVAKGALGPGLAGRDRPLLGAASAFFTVAGHDWSPLLGGAGGRGVSPALGATLVLAPEGTALLLGGLVAGRLTRHTGLATLVATAALVPTLWWRRGRLGLATAMAVAAPMVAKRLTGNRLHGPRRPAATGRATVLCSRLLFDREPRPSPDAPGNVRGGTAPATPSTALRIGAGHRG